jgi:hypothetical protein
MLSPGLISLSELLPEVNGSKISSGISEMSLLLRGSLIWENLKLGD